MQSSLFPPVRRLSFLRRPICALPLLSLVSTLSIFASFALLVGAVRPKTFAFLFKEKVGSELL